MDENNDNQKPCSLPAIDDEGHPNLCCCYIMDADGNLHDSCYRPADECC